MTVVSVSESWVTITQNTHESITVLVDVPANTADTTVNISIDFMVGTYTVESLSVSIDVVRCTYTNESTDIFASATGSSFTHY